MPEKPKDRDCGWFYYAPPTEKVCEPQGYPLPSQIECLNSLPPTNDEEQPRMWLKETDTPFIRLSKLGGRQDLLCFKENSSEKKDPQPYPRVDWFYLEDQCMEDGNAEKALPYNYCPPDYMIHQSYVPSVSQAAAEKPDVTKCNITAKDDSNLQEKIKPGYGIRAARPLDRKCFPKFENMKFPSGKNNNRPLGDDQASMDRLFHNEYKSDKLVKPVQSSSVKSTQPYNSGSYKVPPMSEYNKVYGSRNKNMSGKVDTNLKHVKESAVKVTDS